MSELDKLRELLDEAGAGYLNRSSDITIGYYTDPHTVTEAMDGSLQVTGLTAEQVMRALGHSCNCTNDCTNSERTETCQKVYLVETSDDLIESWHPIGVYLNSKAAGDCAEALRGEVDGIRQFARVVELKVVDE